MNTPPPGGVSLPSPGGRCRRSGGRGAVPSRFWVPPHTRQGLRPCHPLPGEGIKPPPGGSLPLRGRWTGRSPGRMRSDHSARRGDTSPQCLRVLYTFIHFADMTLSYKGKQPNSEKRATLNGSVFHSSWPVLLLGCGPSSVTPYGVPPSPWGKATSRRGALTFPVGEGDLRRGRSLTFPVGEGCLPAGAFPYLPLGEGAAAAAEEGAVPGWFCVPPHTRQGFALPPSPRRG